ncbi:hypothetical protein LINPERPRIM_LOCUS15815 [Linum perenne]
MPSHQAQHQPHYSPRQYVPAA